MRIGLDCYSCFLRQALQAARFTGLEEESQRRVLQFTLGLLLEEETARVTPPELARRINREIARLSGVADPYGEQKRLWTDRALALLPRLEAQIEEADDRLGMGLRVAVAGNIIDLAPGQEIDLERTLARVGTEPFAIDARAGLEAALERAAWVLVLGDNAGETVFDRAFLPVLGRPVKYAVKGGPIINDALREDALQAGLDRVEGVEIIDTGTDMPGTVPEASSAEFREVLERAPLVIAKGQAHFETLSHRADPRLFFLFQVKCPQIARHLGGVAQGSLVLAQGPFPQTA